MQTDQMILNNQEYSKQFDLHDLTYGVGKRLDVKNNRTK